MNSVSTTAFVFECINRPDGTVHGGADIVNWIALLP